MSFDDVQTYATIDGCRFMLCDKCYCFPDCVLYQEKRKSDSVVSELVSLQIEILNRMDVWDGRTIGH